MGTLVFLLVGYFYSWFWGAVLGAALGLFQMWADGDFYDPPKRPDARTDSSWRQYGDDALWRHENEQSNHERESETR